MNELLLFESPFPTSSLLILKSPPITATFEIIAFSSVPLAPDTASIKTLSPFPNEIEVKLKEGVLGSKISGDDGISGIEIVVGFIGLGVATSNIAMSFSSGNFGPSISPRLIANLSTASGKATVIFILSGGVCNIIFGTSISVGNDTLGVTVSGSIPKTIFGAVGLTDIFEFITGSSGSTGFIFAPISIVSLNPSRSTATPFPDVILSIAIFPVDFNKVLPLSFPRYLLIASIVSANSLSVLSFNSSLLKC